MKPIEPMRLLLVACGAAMLAACASIGRPEGGPRDMEPPVMVRSTPAPGALNVDRGRLAVFFNENVSIEDAANKVVVSPPQRQQPIVMANGRRVSVELRDTLIPGTTYTIDFADAIRDLNEGNILDGFALDFSTGDTLDTLAISGMVFEARNLEPAQGMLVGVYRDEDMADTTLTTVPMMRVTKTNQLGRFTVRNLKPGSYRIFAINDLNRDFHWDRSEDIAFYDVALRPSTEAVTVNDTLFGVDGSDSIVSHAAVRYLPDDVLLTWFNENYKPHYLLKHERPEARKMEICFSAPADSLPRLTLLDGIHAGRDVASMSVIEATAHLDSITYWLADSVLIASDTLTVAASYQFTDTLDNVVERTDTLRFSLRGNKNKKKKKEDKKDEKLVPDSVPKGPTEFLNFAFVGGGVQDLNQPMRFSAPTPVERIDSTAIRFQKQVDTLWVDIAPPRLLPTDTLNPREFMSLYSWEPKTRYRLTVDSLGVTDIYGLYNKKISQEFSTRAIEDYAALYFNITGLDSVPAIVELLRNDDPIKTVKVEKGVAALDYLMPGTYYARLYLDRNGNGLWDTGSVVDSVQPEEVFYYPRKINLKKNWDIEQSWNIYEMPVDMQKPQEIKKNKPKKPKWEENSPTDKNNTEEEPDELWDTMSRDPFFNRR